MKHVVPRALIRYVLIPIAIVAAASSSLLFTGASAKSRTFVYRGGGWTLSVTPKQVSYGSTLHGTLTYTSHRYHVEGDWIPAGDAGGDLLRFYGHPFFNASVQGLVGVATLYSTCNPNCAQSRVYALKPVKPWGIPGSSRALHLTLQP